MRCYLCGGTVFWRDAHSYEELGLDEDGTVYFLSCSDCGVDYEIYQTEEGDNNAGNERPDAGHSGGTQQEDEDLEK